MMDTIVKALILLASWFLKVLGPTVIVITWLAFLGLWRKIGDFSLTFIQGSLAWAIGLTAIGLILLALGIVLGRSSD